MRTFIPLLLLTLVLAFFVPAVPARLLRRLKAQPRLVFLTPVFLAAFFCAVVAYYGALSVPLVLLILVYTFVPTICAFVQGPQPGPPSWLDFAIMLMLWLPIELNVGRPWIPREIQGLAHTAIYGIGLLLALVLLGAFRGLRGMKYNLPTQWRDALYVLAAFVAAAVILIPLGLALSFLAPVHALRFSGVTLAWRFVGIWAGTALPEEILFRALIQNWIMQKFGESNWTLLAAAVIFGCSHLNNGPGALPNWRYAILATIAGWLYGKVFQKARQLLRSGAIGQLQRMEATCPNMFDWGTHWFDMLFFYNDETPAEWVIGQIELRGSEKVFGVPVEGQAFPCRAHQGRPAGAGACVHIGLLFDKQPDDVDPAAKCSFDQRRIAVTAEARSIGVGACREQLSDFVQRSGAGGAVELFVGCLIRHGAGRSRNRWLCRPYCRGGPVGAKGERQSRCSSGRGL